MVIDLFKMQSIDNILYNFLLQFIVQFQVQMQRNVSNKPPLRPKNKQVNEPKYVHDEIGLKIRCQTCHQYYYTFETSDHFKRCQLYKQNKILANSPPKIKPKPSKSQPKYEQEEKPALVPRQQQILNEQKQQILKEQKQHHKQQIAQLNRFEQAKIHLSKVVEAKKSRLQNKQSSEEQQQEFEAVDCPFCRKLLKLDELDHADNCAQSTKCEYCDQKIAIALKNSHFFVCIKRLQKQYQRQARLKEQRDKLAPKINTQKKEQKPKPNIAILNKQQNINNRFVRSSDRVGLNSIGKEKKQDQKGKPKPKVQQKRQVKRSPYYKEIPYNIKKEEKAQQNQVLYKMEVEPEINQFDLDMKSRVRALKKKGIPPNVLNRLPRVEYNPSQYENQNMCSVGFEDFNEGEKLIKLACSHIFHQECLFPYLKDNVSCPVCKKEISL